MEGFFQRLFSLSFWDFFAQGLLEMWLFFPSKCGRFSELMRCCWATNTELPIEWCWVCFCCVFPLLMDSGAVRLLEIELYFSPSSASFLVCDPQGVTCSDAAFAHCKKTAHTCSYWKGAASSMEWSRLTKTKTGVRFLLTSICQERFIGAITLLPWLDSFWMTLQLYMIFATFSVWLIYSPLISQLPFTSLLFLIPADCTCLTLTSDTSS